MGSPVGLPRRRRCARLLRRPEASVHTWQDGPKLHVSFPGFRVPIHGLSGEIGVYVDNGGSSPLYEGVLNAVDRVG